MHSTLFTILWIRCARTIHIRTAEATGHRKLAAGLDLALFCLRGSVGLAESGGLQIDLDGYLGVLRDDRQNTNYMNWQLDAITSEIAW
jgi:hypothetical protein